MIERYTRAEMGAIWSEEAKYSSWLSVELAVLKAQGELGLIPKQAAEKIRERANFQVSRIREIERDVKHDVIAFLTNLAENVGEESRYIHLGLTSSDILDTALALKARQAGAILQQGLDELEKTVLAKARQHKHTIMVGRSHGVHAEPITFGLKMAVWLEELRRHKQRLAEASSVISVGKISGAVGTYSNIDPDVEKLVCQYLDLKSEPVSTQIVQRDRHAQYLWTLAVIGTSLEKFATEIRHLQRTDVLEVEEPFTEGQKGSSAMPHKRNPVGCENICGLARLLRANSLAALENIPLWHERDISHSSVERIILPDSTILLDFMLYRFTAIMQDLMVYPENMKRNMEAFGGIVFSQAILLKLVERGLSRDQAYELVQRNAMAAWNKENGNFKANLLADNKISEQLSSSEIEDCFSAARYLRHLDEIYSRLGI